MLDLFLAQGNMGEAFGNTDLISLNGGVGGGKEYEASTEIQKKIVNAAYITPSPGAGWCVCGYHKSTKMRDLDISEETPMICTETTPLHQIG